MINVTLDGVTLSPETQDLLLHTLHLLQDLPGLRLQFTVPSVCLSRTDGRSVWWLLWWVYRGPGHWTLWSEQSQDWETNCNSHSSARSSEWQLFLSFSPLGESCWQLSSLPSTGLIFLLVATESFFLLGLFLLFLLIDTLEKWGYIMLICCNYVIIVIVNMTSTSWIKTNRGWRLKVPTWMFSCLVSWSCPSPPCREDRTPARHSGPSGSCWLWPAPPF